MNLLQIKEWEEVLLLVIMIELTFFVLIVLAIHIRGAMHPSPEVIYYFQNCNNLTLFPDGCQVLS